MEQHIVTQQNVYTFQYIPWRATYLNKPKQEKASCVFCSIPTTNNPQEYILHKGSHSYVILNANPYTNTGYHLLIIPYHHEKHYNKLSDETRTEMDTITQKICCALSKESHEIQINFNIGKNALATIPNHIHQHIIIEQRARFYNIIDALESTTFPIDNATQFTQLLPLFTTSITPYNFSSSLTYKQNCYYCMIMKHIKDQKNVADKENLKKLLEKNLIIHTGKYATILFSHYPFCVGEIIIIPNKHYTNRAYIPQKKLLAMRSFITKMYPLLLQKLNTNDINMGMISYGNNAIDTNHITYQMTPRTEQIYISPINHVNYTQQDIKKIYQELRKNFTNI
jgi:ATP adenylyltransferase